MSEPAAPFGHLLTAMVTPFTASGELDLDGAARLAEHLVDGGHDGLVINGTTGEAPTTTDAEKEALLRVVIEAVGQRARIVAGVGTFDTAHTIELGRTAEKAGAHGLLAVTPYYSRPPQEGLLHHFGALADATGLPVVLYDIPGRTATAIETATLQRLAEHPRIVAVKDATGRPAASAGVIAGCDLVYYSGDDALTLPLLSVGAVGTMGVVTHAVGPQVRDMMHAFWAGDVADAQAANAALLPAYTGFFRSQGAIMVKAAMTLLGLPGGPVRGPLVDASAAQVAALREDLQSCGLELG